MNLNNCNGSAIKKCQPSVSFIVNRAGRFYLLDKYVIFHHGIELKLISLRKKRLKADK